MRNLRILKAYSSGISKLPKGLQNCKKLEEIELQNLALEEFEVEMSKMTNLVELSLAYTKVKRLP